MIDDKKIDIAARAQALSKHINETSYFQLRSIEDFKDGARWAINEFLKNLWHPASEKPEKRNENIIVLQDEDDEDESNPLYAAIVHERHDTFPWNEYCEDNAIYKWCYFKEIAPKKGDKQ